MNFLDLSDGYKFCGSGEHPVDITITPTHSILYVGPQVVVIRLVYQMEESLEVEKVKVNTSTNIKHLSGTFQRNIEIDATEQPLYITLSVRRFTGYTDTCQHGGLRMYHTVSTAIPPDDPAIVKESYVPYDSEEHETLMEHSDQHMYQPICTNESFIFKNKFHLDFGKTILLFYGYSSQFEIDVILKVYPSTYISVFNFEVRYCAKWTLLYIFKSFIINCEMNVIELKQQIPFVLQWSGDGVNKIVASDKIEWFWPRRMEITIKVHYFPYSIAQYYDTDSLTPTYCIRSDKLHITTLHGVQEIGLSLAKEIPMIHVANSEALSIFRRRDACRYIAVLQYSVFLDPTPGDTRCPQSKTKFISLTSGKYHQLLQNCVSLDMIYQRGDNTLLVMGTYLKYPYVNNLVYYYLNIKKACYQGTKILVYYTTFSKQSSRINNFALTTEKSEFMFYDYSFARKLQFTIGRNWNCMAYIHMTVKKNQPAISISKKFFRVCFLP